MFAIWETCLDYILSLILWYNSTSRCQLCLELLTELGCYLHRFRRYLYCGKVVQ